MPVLHPQVPVLGFACDEDIAELITLLNTLRIETLNSCQDNNGRRGATRRVWVEINAEDLPVLLELLDRQSETGDPESLSNRAAPGGREPDDWEAFRENRRWHYTIHVGRSGGKLQHPTVSIRFPRADLPEVVARLSRLPEVTP
jgi:hypothetical protein